MATRADIARWSSWQDVLLPEELPELESYLELYEEQLEIVTGGAEPGPTERFVAQRRAVVVWDFRRISSSVRSAAIRRRGQRTRSGERSEALAESEARRRLDLLCYDELEQAMRFLRGARGEREENEVIPMKRRTA